MKKKILLTILAFSFILSANTEQTGIFEIPDDIKTVMRDNSYRQEGPVKLSELVLVRVKYVNCENVERTGGIIIHKKLAGDIEAIFGELYEAKFPIDKIRLIDEYGNSDELSMEDNNTYAFSVRPKTGKKSFSKHAYGFAVDINPVQNPYIKNNVIEPKNSIDYLDRKSIRKGMIVKGDVCYNAFKKRGWTWGGEWKSLKDYQHFEKSL